MNYLENVCLEGRDYFPNILVRLEIEHIILTQQLYFIHSLLNNITTYILILLFIPTRFSKKQYLQNMSVMINEWFEETDKKNNVRQITSSFLLHNTVPSIVCFGCYQNSMRGWMTLLLGVLKVDRR